MCLASIEVGLDKDVHHRFMVSVDVTHIAIQVVPPLHTTKVHTHEFLVGYMVLTLSGYMVLTLSGYMVLTLLAVERHRTSTL